MLAVTSTIGLTGSIQPAGAVPPAVLPENLQRFVDSLQAVPYQDWLWSALLLSAALLAGWLAASVLRRLIASGAKHTQVEIDDVLVKYLSAPIRMLLPVFCVRQVLPLLAFPERATEWLAHALLVVIVLGIGWILFRGTRAAEEIVLQRFDIAVKDNLRARTVSTQVRALKNVARFVIVVLTLGAALTTFEGVRSLGTGLLASTGVAGIVLGFAAQRSIATVIAGIHIALAQPIRVDDVLIVEGEWGRVEEITLTYVVVKIWDERRLIVPINYFVEKPFQNWTRVSSELLGTVELHLDYSVPLAELRAEFQRILAESEYWDQRVSGVQVVATSERTMTVRPLMSAADAGAAWNLRCEVREKLIEFLQRRYPGALPRLRAELHSDRAAEPSPLAAPS